MRGYKDMWFDEYERLFNEREEYGSGESDQQLAERAHETAVDKIADAADRAHDEERDRKLFQFGGLKPLPPPPEGGIFFKKGK